MKHMTWAEAVEAMKKGHDVRRASESYSKLIEEAAEIKGMEALGAHPAYVEGQEACRLARAWSADEQPVLVFQGVVSGALFVPDSDHRNATDWIIWKGNRS